MDYIKIKDNDYKLVIENIDLNKKYVSSVCAACECACVQPCAEPPSYSKKEIGQLLDNTKTIVTRKLEINE